MNSKIFYPTVSNRNTLEFGDKEAIRGVLQKKKDELGPVTFHQMAVLLLFIILVFLWFFRYQIKA